MNPLTTLVNGTASGALAEATTISTGEVGQIIIFFLAFSILAGVVALIYKAMSKKG